MRTQCKILTKMKLPPKEKLDLKQLPKSQQVIRIHAEVDNDLWELKNQALDKYIYAIAERIFDSGFEDAVVLVPNVHYTRKEQVEKILKDLSFKKNTQVEIFFTDNTNLCAVYSPKKKED